MKSNNDIIFLCFIPIYMFITMSYAITDSNSMWCMWWWPLSWNMLHAICIGKLQVAYFPWNRIQTLFWPITTFMWLLRFAALYQLLLRPNQMRIDAVIWIWNQDLHCPYSLLCTLKCYMCNYGYCTAHCIPFFVTHNISENFYGFSK